MMGQVRGISLSLIALEGFMVAALLPLPNGYEVIAINLYLVNPHYIPT